MYVSFVLILNFSDSILIINLESNFLFYFDIPTGMYDAAISIVVSQLMWSCVLFEEKEQIVNRIDEGYLVRMLYEVDTIRL